MEETMWAFVDTRRRHYCRKGQALSSVSAISRWRPRRRLCVLLHSNMGRLLNGQEQE